jgi:hypothetical protein
MYQDDKPSEVWTYYPERKIWLDDLGAVELTTGDVVDDVKGAIDHAISIIDGTHG